MFATKLGVDTSRFKAVCDKNLSLSTYFPKGTQFYYGYPAGEDSGFLNKVTPATEELVAARAFSCAGPNVSVVSFSSACSSWEDRRLYSRLGVPQLSNRQRVIIPKVISSNVVGRERNILIKNALKKNAKPRCLVMAQPYLDADLDAIYQIPSSLSSWLNDKNNMTDYISNEMLPKRQGTYKSGKEFANRTKELELPVVVKASSSSSGDGVYLCRTISDLAHATKMLEPLVGTILAEELININTNYALHFGIPYDQNLPIDLLGINEQIVTQKGEFMGGLIESIQIPKELETAAIYLRDVILPKVRAMGWYGIGGFDVLTDVKGRAYFIDCNFRMTGMSAFHFMIANGKINKPMMSISGVFNGSRAELWAKLRPYASVDSEERFLSIIALTKNERVWRINGAISFETRKQLKEHAEKLIDAGIKSQVLDSLI